MKFKFWQFVLIWMCAMLLWQVLQFKNDQSEQLREITNGHQIIIVLLVGFLFGTNFAIVNWLLSKMKESIDKLSYFWLIVVYSFIHLVSFFITMLIVFVVLDILNVDETNKDLGSEIYRFILSLNMVRIYVFTFLVSIGIFIVTIVNRKFGPGVLLDLMFGKYRSPKERNMIFLFLDLESSTTYAEKLGHWKYSELIQDCFSDLTKAVENCNAHIYQYIGDEVVLIWPYEEGIENDNCVQLYYQFKKILLNKSVHYINNYGMIPRFKAGLNGGVILAAEVGVIKRSISYYGDVINTASRIQHLCGDLKKEVLISETIAKELSTQFQLDYKFVGDFSLKGKQKTVGIYEVVEI